MKRKVLFVLVCASSMLTMNSRVSAQVLIDYWNFNVDSAAALTPTTSIVSGAGLAYAGAYYDTVQPGTILNGAGADGTTLNAGSAALRLRNPSTGAFTLTLPTTGYKDIVLKYAEQRTNKGAQQNIVTYTVDGTTWINTAIASVATYNVDSVDTGTSGFQLETFSFASDTNVNNNPHFAVQVNFAVGDTNTSGNDRFDNITVYGVADTVHTGIASVSQLSASYTLYPNPVSDNLTILGSLTGDKTIVITDISGRMIYKGEASGRSFSINTSEFFTGDYFITIKEANGGKQTTMNFVKQ